MEEVLWKLFWIVSLIVVVALVILFSPLVLFLNWRKHVKEGYVRYGNVFTSLEHATIFLELEELNRSSWDLESLGRTIRQCPRCEVWHDGANYCSFKCELKDYSKLF